MFLPVTEWRGTKQNILPYVMRDEMSHSWRLYTLSGVLPNARVAFLFLRSWVYLIYRPPGLCVPQRVWRVRSSYCGCERKVGYVCARSLTLSPSSIVCSRNWSSSSSEAGYIRGLDWEITFLLIANLRWCERLDVEPVWTTREGPPWQLCAESPLLENLREVKWCGQTISTKRIFRYHLCIHRDKFTRRNCDYWLTRAGKVSS